MLFGTNEIQALTYCYLQRWGGREGGMLHSWPPCDQAGASACNRWPGWQTHLWCPFLAQPSHTFPMGLSLLWQSYLSRSAAGSRRCESSSIGSVWVPGLHSLIGVISNSAARLWEGNSVIKCAEFSRLEWPLFERPYAEGHHERHASGLERIDPLCRERCRAWWPSSSALCPSRARPPPEPPPWGEQQTPSPTWRTRTSA